MLFSLCLDRCQWFVLDRVARQPVRFFTDHESAVRGGRLKPRGRIDHIAHGKGLSRACYRPNCHDCFAGVDRGAGFLLLFGDYVEDAESRPYGALRVIAMRGGHAEHSHDGVADELLEGSTERFDRALGGRVVGLE